MTLEDFFAALQNKNMVVAVIKDGFELTKIYASGYEQLLTTLLEEEVEKITIANTNNATVELVGTVSA